MRTDSDTVSTTPLHVMTHAEAVAVPTKTPTGTVNSKVNVACGSSRFSLREMPVGEYPTLPSSPDGSGTIAGDVFTQAVAQVAIAADKGDTLPILTGVRM